MLNGRDRLRHTSGFTLIEMIVTLAILAILLALAAPSFQTMVANARLRSTAESVMTGLQLARAEALRRNTSVSFWMVSNVNAGCALSAISTSWVVSLDALNGDCDDAASLNVTPRIVQVRAGTEVGGGVTVSASSAANAAANCITFNGFGAVTANCIGGGTPLSEIDFTSNVANAGSRRIQIAAGGGIRTCDPAVSDANHPLSC